MRPIPTKLREDMANDNFYKYCCLINYDTNDDCNGRIEWHHNLIYAGKQVNEKWCILPLCSHHHSIEKNKNIGELLDYIMLNRATDEELKRYSKLTDYQERRDKLNDKYE